MEPGDLARFEEAMLPHLDAAYTLARYLLREPADAEDAVQDAYLRALRHFGSFRAAGDARAARAWLLTIVRNVCRTLGGKSRDAESFDEERHGAEDGTTDARALARDARETLDRALRKLPEEFRSALVLREIEGLSYQEIATTLEVPVGTVMSRLSRARERLGALLSPKAAT